jgi:hypothetical protein
VTECWAVQLAAPPLITHTAATPQGSPNATLESFRDNLTGCPASSTSSICRLSPQSAARSTLDAQRRPSTAPATSDDPVRTLEKLNFGKIKQMAALEVKATYQKFQ